MNITNNYNGIKNCYLIDTSIVGPTVVIFGGTHGNETSGVKALESVLTDIREGKLKISKGKLILVTIANYKAFELNRRYIYTDLNRCFVNNAVIDNYEYNRAKELMELLLSANYFLDLHSTSSKSIPFIFSENCSMDLAEKLGVGHIILGWGELSNGITSGDTENFVNSCGGKGITFEAGSHDDIDGYRNSYILILNFLSEIGMINYSYFIKLDQSLKKIKIYNNYVNLTGSFKYLLPKVENFIEVNEGVEIGLDGNFLVKAEYDMVLIMPTLADNIEKGKEVFFVGKYL